MVRLSAAAAAALVLSGALAVPVPAPSVVWIPLCIAKRPELCPTALWRAPGPTTTAPAPWKSAADELLRPDSSKVPGPVLTPWDRAFVVPDSLPAATAPPTTTATTTTATTTTAALVLPTLHPLPTRGVPYGARPTAVSLVTTIVPSTTQTVSIVASTVPSTTQTLSLVTSIVPSTIQTLSPTEVFSVPTNRP